MNWARAVICRGLSRHEADAAELASRRYPDHPIVKTAIGGATTANNQGPLAEDVIAREAFTIQQSASLWARLLPLCRVLPFKQTAQRELTGSTGSTWVGEGDVVPIGVGSYDAGVVLPFRNARVVNVLSRETFDFVPTAEQGVAASIQNAIARFMDTTLLDPANTGTASVKPASITSVGVSVTSAGATAANAITDLDALVGAINSALTVPRWIISTKTFSRLALKLGSLGLHVTPNDLLGVPALVGSTVPSGLIALVDCATIAAAFDPGIPLEVFSEGAVQMDSVGTQDGVTPTASTMVSLWQTGLVAITANIGANWQAIETNIGSPNQAAGVSYTTVAY
jgi:hypothetical protein